MQRRAFLSHMASLSAIATTPWLLACTPQRPPVVGIHPWVGYETLHIAREFGWLPEGIQLRENNAARDCMNAFHHSKVDAACLTLDEMLKIRADGILLTAALVFDVSAGGDMLLAHPSIHSLAELAGKRIGVEKNAVGALVLGKVMELSGLPASAVTLVDLSVDHQLAAWDNHAIDAVVTYEPTATMLLRQGAHRLFDSREMPDTIFDVLAVRSDQTTRWQSELKALVAAHFRGLKHLQTNRQDAIYRIAAYQKISPEEAQQALAGVMLPSLAANREYLAGDNSRLALAAKRTSDLMVQQGLLTHRDKLDELASAAWLPNDDK